MTAPIIRPHFSTREEAEAAGVREWIDDEGMVCYIDDDGGGWDLYCGSGEEAQEILDMLKDGGHIERVGDEWKAGPEREQ